METQKNIFDKTPEQILTEKIEYHRAQMKLHKHEMEETRRKLDRLNLDNVIDATDDKILTHPGSDFTMSTWKPRVLEILNDALIPLTSEEILEAIDSTLINDKNIRKKAIGAISNAIQILIKDGIVSRYDNVGRGNKYGIKQKAPASAEAS